MNTQLPKQIILATTNKGKVAEFNLAFKDFPFEILPFPGNFNCAEDGDSFLANATQKAQTAARLCGQVCLADDSGLCVEALNGRPGIYSARYFGQGEGISNILQELKDHQNRKAHFVCALVLADAEGKLLWQTKAKWYGEIALKPAGSKGFGYDPIFIPKGFSVTAAELEPTQKEVLSHRGQAMAQLKDYLKTFLD